MRILRPVGRRGASPSPPSLAPREVPQDVRLLTLAPTPVCAARLHGRYEHGQFYPCSKDAGPHVVGSGPGAGYNINVGWNKAAMGDADYM